MILIEHLLRAMQIQIVLRLLIPRQIENPIQIRPNHIGLGNPRPHRIQAGHLFGRLIENFLRQPGLFQLLAILLDFFLRVIFPELFANGMHFGTQEIFPLLLGHMLSRLSVQLRLDFRDFYRHIRQRLHAIQPLWNVKHF